MALSASSTLAQIHAQYVANQLYDVLGSREMAEQFAEACAWILLKPTESEDRDGRAKFDRRLIQDQLTAVKRWLGQFAAPLTGTTNPAVTKASFETFRD